jgi:LysR family transcriptional regulator, glycine cleavage system transcriptional activator
METLRSHGLSVKALEVFEVVARHRSITQAATELRVTQVAVTRMIARLEASLGSRLFIRSRLGLDLTEEGRILERGVAEGFGLVTRVVSEIKRRQLQRRIVTLSLSGAFIAHWLLPRYQDFQREHPTISLRFDVVSGVLGGNYENVDLALRLDVPPRKSEQSWEFAPEIIAPVCSREYLERNGPINTSTTMVKHTLIEHVPTTLNWMQFGDQTGLRDLAAAPALQFADYALVIQAAMLGRGVALGWVPGLAHTFLMEQLVLASEHIIFTAKVFSLVNPQRRTNVDVRKVKDWFIAQMAKDIARLAERYPTLVRT